MANIMRIMKGANHGRLRQEIDKALMEAFGATAATGGKSTVTLKIDIEMAESHIDARGTNRFDVKGSVKAALPRPNLSANTYYVDCEMHLSERDPNQMDLDGLQTVDGADAARQLRKASGGTE